MPSCILDYCALRDAKVLFIAYRTWVRLEVGNKTPKKKAKNTKQVGPMRKIWIAASFTSPHQRWANLQQFETMKCDWALQPLPLPHNVVIDVSQKSKEDWLSWALPPTHWFPPYLVLKTEKKQRRLADSQWSNQRPKVMQSLAFSYKSH